MTISFFDIEKSETYIFKDRVKRHRLLFNNESLTLEAAKKNTKTEILYVRSLSQVTADILRELPKLEFIATRSTGFDNIDLDYCKKKGITVSNVPSYANNSVAENTFLLMLALSHKLMPAVSQTKSGHFDMRDLRGFEIMGKTLGVIGLGNIGSRVVEIAKGFDMKVLVTTKHPSPERAKKHQVKFVDLPILLKKSDIITLHVPLTDETYHMINKKNIGLMKKGSLLINTSRGAVVETEEVILALEKGVLAGSGLDVLEDESIFSSGNQNNHPLYRKLLDKKNVIITPHNAYNSHEAIQTILTISAENINAYLEGKPINRVI